MYLNVYFDGLCDLLTVPYIKQTVLVISLFSITLLAVKSWQLVERWVWHSKYCRTSSLPTCWWATRGSCVSLTWARLGCLTHSPASAGPTRTRWPPVGTEHRSCSTVPVSTHTPLTCGLSGASSQKWSTGRLSSLWVRPSRCASTKTGCRRYCLIFV